MIQYERRRIELVSYFEAVRHAQQVQVDEIPLPAATGNDMNRAYPGKNSNKKDFFKLICIYKVLKKLGFFFNFSVFFF